MQLSYGQVEAILVGHLGVHPDKVGTLRARIKQLQKLQFPPGVNVGRGTKMMYSAESAFQLVSVFELINLGQPALTATNLVKVHWQSFAAGYGIAIHQEFSNAYRQSYSTVYFRIHLSALSALRGEDDDGSFVWVESIRQIQREIEEEPERDADSFLLLCASHIMRRVVFHMAERARVEAPAEDDEFAQWYATVDPHMLQHFVPTDGVDE